MHAEDVEPEREQVRRAREGIGVELPVEHLTRQDAIGGGEQTALVATSQTLVEQPRGEGCGDRDEDDPKAAERCLRGRGGVRRRRPRQR